MAFSDETSQWHRWFNYNWGPRAETAEEIAQRLQAMARDFRRDEPDLSPLWLQFSSRATRPTDLERVDELAIEDLSRLIDRRGRFDPPQLPAPVGPMGYSLLLGGPPSTDPARRLDISIRAGRTEDAWPGNGGVLNFLTDAPVWQDAERGLAILRAVVRAWEPDRAGAYARRPQRDDEPYDSSPPVRPWLTWKRHGADYQFYEFTDVGLPTLVQSEFGGELRVWP